MSTPKRSIVGTPPAARQMLTPRKRPSRLGHATKRHRKVMKDTIMGITKPDLRRLARRGGVKRVSFGIYEEARVALKSFLRGVIGDAVACVELARRQTMTFRDVLYALKRRGHTLYGFGPEYDKQHHR